MATFLSYQTAFVEPGESARVRPIEVPEEEAASCETPEELAEVLFHYGQNDFQPVPERYSMSVGDVVDMRSRGWGFWKVEGCGFSKVEPMTVVRMRKGLKDGEVLWA